MSNPIVKITVAQRQAPAPPTLQKTGALVSQGGTTLAVDARSLLTQLSDLTPLLAAPVNLASLTQSGGLATATLPSTTIASATYNSTTGLVTLTLNASLDLAPGDLVAVDSATGTGSFAAIDGTFQCGAGTSGTTVTYTVATGLTMTISGGNAKSTHGLSTNATFLTKVSGAAQAGYNGTFLATVTGATTFTYAVPSATVSPATGTPAATLPNQAELLEMATTFFAQGAAQSVYVLELGAGTPAQGVAALDAYIAANPGAFYLYVIPRNWDAVSAFITLLGEFETTTSKTYFLATTTGATYQDYAGMKDVLALVETPGVQASEFDAAAIAQVVLNYAPSSTNRVTPLNFAFLFGVTPYPTSGNGALLEQFSTGNVNVVGTGAQGGLSDDILVGGKLMDGNPFNYWYSVDWVQINARRNVTAALINGSNNPTNPLYYDQAGINALQQVIVSTMAQGIANGLVLNPIKATTLSAAAFLAALDAGTFDGFTVVNADPFASYVAENPTDYSQGTYKGFSILYVPLRGFDSIVVNITVSSFA